MSRQIWWTLHGHLPNAVKKFLLPGVLHNIVIKHGLSLAEETDDNSQIGMKNYLNLRRAICQRVTKIITKGRNKTLRWTQQMVEGNVQFLGVIIKAISIQMHVPYLPTFGDLLFYGRIKKPLHSLLQLLLAWLIWGL